MKTPEKETYPSCEFARVDEVHGVNHKPHPYMIGPNHLSRNDSMYLGESQIMQMESNYGAMCYWKGKYGNGGERCRLRYEEHTCDHVAFVVLNRDCTKEEMHEWLLNECKPWAEEYGLDGFAFVEGFEIT